VGGGGRGGGFLCCFCVRVFLLRLPFLRSFLLNKRLCLSRSPFPGTSLEGHDPEEPLTETRSSRCTPLRTFLGGPRLVPASSFTHEGSGDPAFRAAGRVGLRRGTGCKPFDGDGARSSASASRATCVSEHRHVVRDHEVNKADFAGPVT